MNLAFSIIIVMAVFVVGAIIAFEIALIKKDEDENDNTKRPKDYDDD